MIISTSVRTLSLWRACAWTKIRSIEPTLQALARLAAEDDRLVFKKCYFDESWYSASLGGSTLTLSDRKLSTYVNALAQAGFVIEQLIEESDEELMGDNDFANKAKMLPVTFVIKARKR